jgi:fluoroacetyl-CoA thioesterase
VKPIPPGVKSSATLLVNSEHLANHTKDASLPPVLATPVMIMVMENAALNALKPFLEQGETAVGTRIDVRHISPSSLGMRVLAEARVTRVEGRRVEFRVSATDETGQIGIGSHERVVIKLAQMDKHVAARQQMKAEMGNKAGGSA